MRSGLRRGDGPHGVRALLVLVPVVWAVCAPPPIASPATSADPPVPARHLPLRIGVPIPHVEETPHLDDDPADPVQLEPLAVGPEAGGYVAPLAPLALLATRDLAMHRPLARFSRLPPRPPPRLRA